jgi:PAB-dependent poly(A)-specific ribonuclease subunit 3
MAQGIPSAPYNPYLEENSAMPSNGAAYYQPQPSFTAPAQPVSTTDDHIVSIADTASFNTTCTLLSDLTERISTRTKRPSTISSSPMLFEKTCRRNLKPPSKSCQVYFLSASKKRLLTIAAAQLPVVDHYHSLVPLDTNHNKSAAVFGFPSWVYKATSSKTGLHYVLRRIEGGRLSLLLIY